VGDLSQGCVLAVASADAGDGSWSICARSRAAASAVLVELAAGMRTLVGNHVSVLGTRLTEVSEITVMVPGRCTSLESRGQNMYRDWRGSHAQGCGYLFVPS
jgi:hypothetical protein